MPGRPLAIEVFKGPTRRYRSVLHRADGVDVELDGGAYNKVGGRAGEVPHDIAHLVVEEELGLSRGIWGVLASGGLFRGASVLSGRQRPHATTRAREILEASVEQLNQAEVLTRAICDQALAGTADANGLRTAVGPRWWSDAITEHALDAAFRRLHEAGAAWARLPAGDHLRFTWHA
jgi:hypothetical protein